MFFNVLKKIYLNSRYDEEYISKYINPKEARSKGIKLGEDCRIHSLKFSTEPYLIEIGNHVYISKNVSFTTHDGGVWIFRNEYPLIELFGKITIGNNVYVGLNSTILLNTNIGSNSIVLEGSLVKGSFEDNSVIGGVPAKRISSIREYYEQHFEKNNDKKNIK